ncbi:MAG: acetyltransferase [Clostridiales Family XIII bacterium]|nr:acetyltransferase [Clostridiales Family XIII bacterium]
MKDLYIIGAGGFGREVADIVRAINAQSPAYRIAGFIDDDETLWGGVKNDIPVPGGREYLKDLAASGASGVYAVIAIADAKIKEKIAAYLQDVVIWENIVHPAAVVSAYCEMGRGNIVQAHAFVSANVRVGNHCMINTHSGLGHDAALADYASVMGHCDITGNAHVGKGAYLATSAAVIPNVRIGEYAYICAGSVVFKDVKANAVMIGNPARQVK